MKRKFTKILIAFVISCFFLIDNSYAKEMTLDELNAAVIDKNASAGYYYLIGEYVFTSTHTPLTLEDMMLAARTIKVSANAGETNSDSIYKEMTTYQFTAVRDSNYVITGYKYRNNFTGESDLPETFDVKYIDYELIEEETKEMYTVTFKNDGGVSTTDVEEGSIVEEPTTPTKEHYSFEGWYKEDGTKFDFTTPINDDITLTAKWVQTTCVVTFKGMDNTNEFTEKTINCGDALTSLATPTSSTKGDFVNWYIGSEIFDLTTKINEDIELTAKFEQDFIHTVTFYDGEDELIELLQQVKEGETAIEPEAPIKDGYTFVEWLNDKMNPFNFTTKIMYDISLYANYEVNTYNVKFYDNGIELTELSTTIEHGKLLEEPTMEDEVTAKFGGWYIDKDITTAYDFSTPVTSDLELHVNWIPTVQTVYDEESLLLALTNTDIKAVEVTDDFTLSNPLKINRAIEINGNGHTITANYTSDATSFITLSGKEQEIIMSNIIIDANQKGRGIKVTDAKLVFEESQVINGKAVDYAGGIMLTDESEIEFINSTLTGNKIADSYAASHYLQYTSDLWIGSEAVGTITSGNIDNMFINGNEYGNGLATVNGGTIDNVYLEYSASHGSTLNYVGGTISNLYISSTTDEGVSTHTANPTLGTYTSIK